MSLCDPRSTSLALLAGLTLAVGCQQASGPTSAAPSSGEQAETESATTEETPSQTAATPAPESEDEPSESAQAAKSADCA